MRTTTAHHLAQLQRKPGNIRNLCILAHVDHGKTTLADALVASNGIISQRMVGKLRYMDNREDEQLRGITMKSSAISLHFQEGEEEYLINLIDSPGHVDFSSEVSTAVRLCDGAIVVVDVVEGVCPQTHAVLRQAWLENIKPILVLNKIDRLITELKMETLEAFIHLQRILEHVNIVTSELFTADIMEKTSMNVDSVGDEADKKTQNYDWTEDADEYEDKNIYFSPDQGNVVFASAYDGWGFTIEQFADLFSQKLGMSKVGLRKTLWGDFYLNSKTKRIMKGAQSKGKKPLFVQFILENIWSVYESVFIRRDKDMMEKIVKSLGLKMTLRDSRHNDPRIQLQAVLGQWLPVSKSVLGVVVDQLPSPMEMVEERVERLLCSQARRFDSLPSQTQDLKKAFLSCSSDTEMPTIVFVSKMFPFDASSLPKHKRKPLTDEEMKKRREQARINHAAKMTGQAQQADVKVDKDGVLQSPTTGEAELPSQLDVAADSETDNQGQVFIAFARIYSGTIRKGQRVYVLGPKHDPAKALEQILSGAAEAGIDDSKTVADLPGDQHLTAVTVKDLYLFMGRELEELDAVPAGNILGIGGLQDHILKSGTLSSTLACSSFTDMYFDASPILRVAIEPVQAGDMQHLSRGLKLLNQADPCVQVLVQETGEHVIITAGEVHLRRCLDDLRDRYAKIEINVSSPIVPFRETIVLPPKLDMVNESIQDQNQVTKNDRKKAFEEDEEVLEEGLVRIFTPDKSCVVQIRAVPLLPTVTDILEDNQFLIKTVDQYASAKLSEKSDLLKGSKLKKETITAIQELKDKLEEAFSEGGKEWVGAVDRIWAFGPRRVGPNLLLNRVEGYDWRPSIWQVLSKSKRTDHCNGSASVRDFDYSIVSGFQLATLVGPLCEEPMRGVCFIMEKWQESSAADTCIADLNTKLSSCKVSGAESRQQEQISNGVTHGPISDTDVKCSLLEKKSMSQNQLVSGLQDSETESQLAGNNQSTHSKFESSQSEMLSHNDAAENQAENIDQSYVSPCKSSQSERVRHDTATSVDGFEIETSMDDVTGPESVQKQAVYGHVSGQLISCVKDGCRKAFQTQPQRLMVAMYKCNIQATTDVLGKLYAVIGKRNGRITGEDLREGSQVYTIHATLPVIESFGFADDIRKKTSGLASPQLVFSHWEVIDVDPFWVPTTEEEIMHYGEKADSENCARAYMNAVRKRKGLKVDEKIVEHAEKQRTLTRNK